MGRSFASGVSAALWAGLKVRAPACWRGDNSRPMTVPSTVAAAVPGPTLALQQELRRRLHKLGRVFDIAALRRDSLPAGQVVQYYEDCHDAYRKYHSAEGAVHMALNDGDRFDPDGFFGQLRRLEAGWGAPPTDVLELAFGQGFNLEYLARRHPGTHFHGIDLTPAHQRIAAERLRRAGLANAALSGGDFHHLPYADASMEAVFCIEAFCYATDLPRALAEVRRVLRPGGRFTLFDGYYTRPLAAMKDDEALAAELVARGMAMDTLQVQSELLAAARAAGFVPSEPVALDAAVMPSLRRLERVTGAVIRWPWLGRRALARRSALRGRNVLAGYLMRTTVALGLIGYRQLALDVPR
jgi:SAM-dependent methyltransferase